MYISKILIVGSKNTRTRKILETSLKELGYFVNYKNSNGIIYIGNLSKKILLKLLNNKAKIIIFVDTNGEYVIPLTGEERGGSIIGGIIADILNAQLILTSKFSEKGLISIKEFCWINALKPLNSYKIKEINNKFIRNKLIKIYNDDLTRDYYIPDGYESTNSPENAYIIISEKNYWLKEKLILKPIQVIVGVLYKKNVPEQVIKNVIELTNKSIGISPRRVDKIIRKEFEEDIKLNICKSLLLTNNARIILKPSKRALNVYTCLGVSSF